MRLQGLGPDVLSVVCEVQHPAFQKSGQRCRNAAEVPPSPVQAECYLGLGGQRALRSWKGFEGFVIPSFFSALAATAGVYASFGYELPDFGESLPRKPPGLSSLRVRNFGWAAGAEKSCSRTSQHDSRMDVV